MYSSSGTSRSMATIAPMPERLKRSTAFAVSSATSVSPMCRKKRSIGECPITDKAMRSSGAKMMRSAIAPYV